MTGAQLPLGWYLSPNPGSPNVFVPGVVKPINAGSAERAARIVQCVNLHDELVQQLRDICALADKNVSMREDGTPHRTAEAQALYDKTVALIAKAGSAA